MRSFTPEVRRTLSEALKFELDCFEVFDVFKDRNQPIRVARNPSRDRAQPRSREYGEVTISV